MMMITNLCPVCGNQLVSYTWDDWDKPQRWKYSCGAEFTLAYEWFEAVRPCPTSTEEKVNYLNEKWGEQVKKERREKVRENLMTQPKDKKNRNGANHDNKVVEFPKDPA
jgi:hypothetical protein